MRLDDVKDFTDAARRVPMSADVRTTKDQKENDNA